MICWFCYWGWHPQVKAIFDEAVAQIGGEDPLLFGPSHIVWEDENFHSAQWCLDEFDNYKGDYSEHDLTIVRRSLERLIALPAEFKTEPADYDGKHPENYCPAWLRHQFFADETPRVDDLKPCPWCGEKNASVRPTVYHVMSAHYPPDGPTWTVECHTCAQFIGPYRKTEKEARKAWNTRPLEGRSAQ